MVKYLLILFEGNDIIMIEKTRQILFLQVRPPTDPHFVMEELDFKGCVRIMSPTSIQIHAIWAENRSVICSTLPKDMELDSSIHTIHLNANTAAADFQNYCHEHCIGAGDHRKETSGLNGAPSIEDCFYCEYIRNDYYDPHRQMLRTFYKTENFFVMVGLGEFIKGYVLIIPKAHVMSNACFSEELQAEFYQVLEDVKYILQLTYPHYSEFLVWENGTGNGGRGKAKTSVVHSHVHVAPSSLCAEKIAAEHGLSFRFVNYDHLSDFNQVSYLAIRDKNRPGWHVIDSSRIFIVRQFIRQILAEEYGLPGEHWNWRKFLYKDLIQETMEDIQSALAANWSQLPQRIRECTEYFLPSNYKKPL